MLNRPFIIPIFIPHYGCPHQCSFCNQKLIAGSDGNSPSSIDVRGQVDRFISYNREKRPVEIAFFGGNFLGQKRDSVRSFLQNAGEIVEEGRAEGIRFSTRPDTINEDILAEIAGFPVQTIELGVQSMNDRVLSLSNRGHSTSDTRKAVFLLKQKGYKTGLQMMTGLPGDTDAGCIQTGHEISELLPDFVRIYPTVVLSGSPLATAYKKGEYVPMPLSACISLVKNLYLLFRNKNIPVIRMGLHASEDLNDGEVVLAGPYHPAFGHLVFSEIFLDRAVSELNSSGNSQNRFNGELILKVHRRSISKMRGLKNSNIDNLKKKFDLGTITVLPDDTLDPDEVVVTRQ